MLVLPRSCEVSLTHKNVIIIVILSLQVLDLETMPSFHLIPRNQLWPETLGLTLATLGSKLHYHQANSLSDRIKQ